jgi:hypothetical protein
MLAPPPPGIKRNLERGGITRLLGQVLILVFDGPQAVAEPAQAMSAVGTSRKYTPTAAMWRDAAR